MQIGIEDGLCPGSAAIFSHDRGDDIDQLGDTRHLDTVSVAEQGHQQAANQQCILEIVDIFQLRGRDLPGFEGSIGVVGMVPDVPFIDREVDGFIGMFFRLYAVSNRGDRLDEGIKVKASRKEFAGIVSGVVVVAVQ